MFQSLNQLKTQMLTAVFMYNVYMHIYIYIYIIYVYTHLFIFWCFAMDSLMSPFLEWHLHRHSSKNQAVKSLPATSPTTIPALIQTVLWRFSMAEGFESRMNNNPVVLLMIQKSREYHPWLYKT